MNNSKKDEDPPRKGWREAFKKEKDPELTQEDRDFINMPSECPGGDCVWYKNDG